MPDTNRGLKPISVQDFYHYYLSNCTSATAEFNFADGPKITAIWFKCKAETKGGSLEIVCTNGSFAAPMDSIVEVVPRLTDDDIRHGEKTGLDAEPSAFTLTCDSGTARYTLSLKLVY